MVARNNIRRIVRLTALLAAVVPLVSCSVGANSGGSAPETSPTVTGASGIDVRDPKDAGSVESCSLLPAKGAESIGLVPGGRAASSSFGEDNLDSCAWKNEDGSISSALSVFDDRSLQDYYDNADKYVDFEKMTIAGHPAVRANENDPMSDGACILFLASNSGQVVQATAIVPTSRISDVDPCGLAAKTLDAAVPSWPSV